MGEAWNAELSKWCVWCPGLGLCQVGNMELPLPRLSPFTQPGSFSLGVWEFLCLF